MKEHSVDAELIQREMFSEEDEEQVSLSQLTAYPRRPDVPPSTIRRLWLRNMKVFKELTVDFGSFNVLVGVNNCGKSTVLQAIDLCFRLIAFHSEFRGGMLTKPRAGRRLLESMLPVASADDFWFSGKTREGNERVPVCIGVELLDGSVFEFEIRSLWGGLNSRMTRLPDGSSEEDLKAILARRPTLIPYAVGVVTQEEYRAPARLELLSATGHRNEVLRNFIRELGRRNPNGYKRLQADLQLHFGASITEIEFELERDQYVEVRYSDGILQHDIFSVGGGFLQVLQLLTYLYLETPGIVLLDEPDAHLHSSMQRLVVDLLTARNKSDHIQVIMATHSKELINYVDPSHILPITRDTTTAKSLERHSSVLPILQDMGAIDNVDLAALVGSRRCVFIEGGTDKRLLARFAAKLSSIVFEGRSQVVPIVTEGVDNPEAVVNVGILEQIVGHSLSTLIVRDRDGLPDEFVTEIGEMAKSHNRNVHVLQRTHIENYLLDPTVIHRLITEELAKSGKPPGDVPSRAEVEADIERVVDSLRDDAFDNTAVHIQQHHVRYRGKHIDAKVANGLARAFIDEQWTDLGKKLLTVEGKKAMKAVRAAIQNRWKVSFSDVRVIEAMSPDDVPEEIRRLIAALESL